MQPFVIIEARELKGDLSGTAYCLPLTAYALYDPDFFSKLSLSILTLAFAFRLAR